MGGARPGAHLAAQLAKPGGLDMRRLTAVSVALSLLAAPVALAASQPASWDGLTRVKSKKADAVYLLPGADFRAYTKVQLDPTEVAFQKNWLRDYNDQTMGLSSRISDAEAKKLLGQVRTGFEDIFRDAYTKAGYQVVTEPGPDVLRVRTAVANLRVNAPDRPTASRSRTYSREAGEATLILEARDSTSGALLGRAVDARLAGDTGPYMRNSVTNRSDFSRLFKSWAQSSANGLIALKTVSPAAAAN
jgi:hypothetical protein